MIGILGYRPDCVLIATSAGQVLYYDLVQKKVLRRVDGIFKAEFCDLKDI